MEVREMLELYGAPSVKLSDIVVQNLPQKRLINLLMEDGIGTTAELRNMSDDDLLALNLFGKMKLDKLREFITDWYEAEFPIKNYLNVNKPETVVRSLEDEVFGTYKNLSIIAMRGQYKTFEEIALMYGQSRQSVQDKEKAIQKKFEKWYITHNIAEKIGDWDELVTYCNMYFPADQTMMRVAVRRMATVAKRKK